jgi:hypothetical protein
MEHNVFVNVNGAIRQAIIVGYDGINAQFIVRYANGERKTVADKFIIFSNLNSARSQQATA